MNVLYNTALCPPPSTYTHAHTTLNSLIIRQANYSPFCLPAAEDCGKRRQLKCFLYCMDGMGPGRFSSSGFIKTEEERGQGWCGYQGGGLLSFCSECAVDCRNCMQIRCLLI